MNDCEIIFIDKTDSSDPTRKGILLDEGLNIAFLKTTAPLGPNIDEGYDY